MVGKEKSIDENQSVHGRTALLADPERQCWIIAGKEVRTCNPSASHFIDFHSPALAARRMTELPSTSTSILVRRKQSKASSGRHTTGSFSLNDVFSTIGTPVSRENASIRA